LAVWMRSGSLILIIPMLLMFWCGLVGGGD
jgi:hypothetical protein